MGARSQGVTKSVTAQSQIRHTQRNWMRRHYRASTRSPSSFALILKELRRRVDSVALVFQHEQSRPTMNRASRLFMPWPS